MKSPYLDLLARYGISSAHPGGLALTRQVLGSLPITAGTRLLDLGCGTGETLSYIAENYPCRLTGVDIDSRMLTKAALRFNRENLRIDLVRADAASLPFPAHTFDIALSESVTVFTPIERALKEYARVLKPGGTLAAIEMASLCPLSESESRVFSSLYGIERLPTVGEWGEMFRDAGFKSLRAHEITMRPEMKPACIKMWYDFAPHIIAMRLYGRKLKFMVYLTISTMV